MQSNRVFIKHKINKEMVRRCRSVMMKWQTLAKLPNGLIKQTKGIQEQCRQEVIHNESERQNTGTELRQQNMSNHDLTKIDCKHKGRYNEITNKYQVRLA